MDLQRLKQISEAKIKAGILTKEVRDTLKEYKNNKQDLQLGLSETFKPIIKAQEETKQTIDAKQDKLIEQLDKNQKAITSALVLPYSEQVKRLELSGQSGEQTPQMISDMNKGFTEEELETIQKYKLPLPGDVLLETIKDPTIIKKVIKESGDTNQRIGLQKGQLSSTKTAKKKNKDKIAKYDKEIETIRKYRNRIGIIEEGQKTLKTGSGYNQPKRNAYKINQYGQYGGLMIDIPKLMGQLRLIASKDGQKVLDKKVDFDTIDLLTKRFNSKKKYSDIAKMVFNELNQLSEIPIHKTSNKFKKIGSGVVYFDNINDLVDRMELLGGSILAGNNSVKK